MHTTNFWTPLYITTRQKLLEQLNSVSTFFIAHKDTISVYSAFLKSYYLNPTETKIIAFPNIVCCRSAEVNLLFFITWGIDRSYIRIF